MQPACWLREVDRPPSNRATTETAHLWAELFGREAFKRARGLYGCCPIFSLIAKRCERFEILAASRREQNTPLRAQILQHVWPLQSEPHCSDCQVCFPGCLFP